MILLLISTGGKGSPLEGVNGDTFSIRWTGAIQPRYTEKYTFYLASDNGRRLWVNGQLVINKWINDSATYSGQIRLEADKKYKIKIEYFESVGNANCVFEWSSSSQPRQIVPQSQLYSVAEDPVGGGDDGEHCWHIFFYPNPVRETLYLRNVDSPVDIAVLNKLGRQIMTAHGTSLDVSDLNSGTYYLKVKSKRGCRVFRLIKQ